MKIRTCGFVAGVAAFCGVSLAQYSGGVNVDLNVASGAGAGQPTILFSGAIGQGGYWTPVVPPLTRGTSVPIRDLGNSINAVSMSMSWPGGAATRSAFSFNNTNTSGDAELLLDDALDLGGPGNGVHTFALSTFSAGLYRVATYAVAPDSAAYRTDIQVRTNQGSYGTQTVGGAIPGGGAFTQGVTHAQHDVPLFFDGPLFIDATTSASSGTLNGIQVQRLSPTRLYVRQGAALPGAGLSWAAPLGHLQTALAIARTTPSVTEIWVAGGTYFTDSFPETTGNASAAFVLRSNLAVYGGFAGTEASIAERNLNNPATETVLDGHGIAGVIVRGTDCTGVTLNGLTAAHGASGFAFSNSTATMTRCVARDNRLNGSGVLVDASFGSTVTLDRCAAVNNTSGSASGSILHLFVGGTLNVNNTLIANNDIAFNLMDASTGGGSYFRNCTIANNRGVDANDYVRLSCAPLHEIRNCVFWGNTIGGSLASEAGLGGVIDGVVWNAGAVTDSIIQGWTGTLGSSLDFNNGSDPRFVAPVPAGVSASPVPLSAYALASRSPARDSGWNGGVAGAVDFFGNARTLDDPYFPNTGFAGGFVDRGYAEAQDESAICPGDVGRQGGLPGPDGVRDNNDFVVFIDLFFLLDPRADLGRQGGVPGADGFFNNNDFVVFIDLFFTPC